MKPKKIKTGSDDESESSESSTESSLSSSSSEADKEGEEKSKKRKKGKKKEKPRKEQKKKHKKKKKKSKKKVKKDVKRFVLSMSCSSSCAVQFKCTLFPAALKKHQAQRQTLQAQRVRMHRPLPKGISPRISKTIKNPGCIVTVRAPVLKTLKSK